MRTIRYTLVTDGSSDSALKSILDWIIASHRPDLGVIGEVAREIGAVGLSLDKKVPAALRLFPCDLLFIHRDAERDDPAERSAEIERAVKHLHANYVPVIPVRMTEAWLLSDEVAIRSAAENRSGRVALNLPPKRSWEALPDPKRVLFDALIVASEKKGRALTKFSPSRQRGLVALRTLDFSALRGVPSFDELETKLLEKLNQF
jgi:hypothetical protein